MDRVEQALLPVHGFVLAGGQSSRMGQDKALLSLYGRPMVAFALETLRQICEYVSIAGNRPDLEPLADIALERRVATGPAAGLEAGLQASACEWALFVPVDVPMVPVGLLRSWAEAALKPMEKGVKLSYLRVGGRPQPTFCLLHRSCLPFVTETLDAGERKLEHLFARVAAMLGPGTLLVTDGEALVWEGKKAGIDLRTCFANVNTPEDLARLTAQAKDDFALRPATDSDTR